MSRSTLLILILCVLGAVTYWIYPKQSKPTIALTDPETQQRVDYRMDGFTSTLYDENGKAFQRLSGERLLHYPSNDAIKITAPKSETLNKENAWQLRAKNAATTQTFSEIIWEGDVTLETKSQQSIMLESQTITQTSSPKRLTSNQPTRVTFDNGTIKANGFTVDLNESTLDFEGDVRSVYQ